MVTKRKLTLLAVEIQRSFQKNPNSSYAYAVIPNLITLGQMVRILNILEGRTFITAQTIHGLAALFDIQPAVVTLFCDTCKELGWIEMRGEKYEEHVPQRETAFEEISQHILRKKPLNPIESAFIETIDKLEKRPYRVEALLSELSLDPETWNELTLLGRSSHLFHVESSKDMKPYAYSPLSTYNKGKELQEMISGSSGKVVEQLGDLYECVYSSPGIPTSKIKPEYNPILHQAIEQGLILPFHIEQPVIKGHIPTFLFPPSPEFEDRTISGDVFEKARALISSLRYGQYLAPISKIFAVDAVVQKLASGERLRPHSVGKEQYYVSFTRGLIDLSFGPGVTFHGRVIKGYSPQLIMTEENRRVIKLVGRMLSESASSAHEVFDSDIVNAERILGDHVYDFSDLDSFEYRGAKRESVIRDPKLKKVLQDFAIEVSGGVRD